MSDSGSSPGRPAIHMESFFHDLISGWPLVVLLLIIALSLLVLAKGADLLVEEAVGLSVRWGVPKMVIGATIVSLGTTLPEAAVSVAAAVSGNPGLALGNAVGSIIADTGLILGLAAMIAPLPLERQVVNRQGWIQLGSGFLLVLACFPWSHPGAAFSSGGHLPQWVGIAFLVLLAAYIWLTLHWARQARSADGETEAILQHVADRPMPILFLKLVIGIALVVGAAQVLIPAVEVTALRVGVPDAIIAATLVAFGTSLPELVTAVTAARKGHGELAVGNVIGADILNVLFVAGASAAVTAGGLMAPPQFFQMLFPAMLAILIVFRLGVAFSGTHLRRPFGLLLIGIYVAITLMSYLDG